MKKILLIVLGVLFPIISFCGDEPPHTYIIPGHIKVLGYVNGWKVIACLAPYDVTCYIITTNSNPDSIQITCGNETFHAESSYITQTDSEGNQIYSFKVVE